MDLFLDPGAGKPLTTQLYEQLRDAITAGRLHTGDQLVPSRQLASELGASTSAIMGAGAMHLPERCGGGGMMLEAGEFLLPVGAELGAHAALDEGPAHGRRLALQLHQFGGVFGRQGIGNGGHELGHLHDRPLEAAKRRRQLGSVLAAVEREPE